MEVISEERSQFHTSSFQGLMRAVRQTSDIADEFPISPFKHFLETVEDGSLDINEEITSAVLS